jgi:putative nucleotidyltransferase with HDIG domain
VIQAHLYEQVGSRSPGGLDLDELWAHSVAVANAARRMMVKSKRPRVEQDITFLAGLLHDVGRLVLAQGRPKDYRALTRACGGLPDSEREIEVYGACHADVGAYLLGLWGLPEEAVEALAWHHQPGACPFRVCCTTTAVHIADAAHHAHVLGVDIQDLLDSEHIDALEPVLEMADMLDTCNAIFARNTTP